MSQVIDLTERVALVTGAARRLGAAIADTLHAAGMRVAIHFNTSADDANALADTLNAKRADSATVIGSDLTDPSAFESLVRAAQDRWGRLDCLINNASRFYPTPLADISHANWQDLVTTNLMAPLFLTQAAAPALRATNGTVINITDIHAERPIEHYNAYCATKAGLVSLTKSLARELGPQVRVNSVAPGAILWPEVHPPGDVPDEAAILAKTALKRAGEPGDIARTVLFLVRDAPYITGQNIAVDGGRVAQQ
ncbi:MAG: pteridine reductase [Pseudomonadota bacterium]